MLTKGLYQSLDELWGSGQVLRILAAAIFLIAGLMKLVGQPMMAQEFDTIGVGQWFRYLTGLLEIIGGVCVLMPRYSALGALLLLVVNVGAFIAQIAILHMDWIHPIIIGALLAALVYLQRDKIPGVTRLSSG